MESFYFRQKDIPTGFSCQKEQNKWNHKNKSAQSQNNGNGKRTGKKRKREKKDWKDKDVELVGIPTDILKERKKVDFCLKCGKNAHKWYECWTKTPITTRVTKSNKRNGDSKPEKAKKEEVKISAVRGHKLLDYSEEKIIELAKDTEGDYVLLK